jgi:hypothetical protein
MPFKAIILILVLTGLYFLIFVVWKVVLPKFQIYLEPILERLYLRLNSIGSSKADSKWERAYLEIMRRDIDDLKNDMDRILKLYGRKRRRPTESRFVDAVDKARLPSALRNFFDEYESLSFDQVNHILDDKVVRKISAKGNEYLLIGEAPEQGGHYAVLLNGKESTVFFMSIHGGKIQEMEEEAPSFEHFIVLSEAVEKDSAEILRHK